MKMKKTYERPATAVTHIELESPICTGSTNFTGPEGTNGVHVSGQNVITPGKEGNDVLNDFTTTEWGINQNVNQ